MAAKTAFCLLLTLFAVQIATADLDIEDILKDPTKIIEELESKLVEVEDGVKDEANKLIAKAEDAFAELEQKIEEEVAKGGAAGQCLTAKKDDLSSLLKVGEQDVTACANKAITDVGPLAAEVAVAVKDVGELYAECGSGNAVTIGICLATHAEEVATTLHDISTALEDIPSTYTSLKSDIESCEGKLSTDVENIETIIDACV